MSGQDQTEKYREPQPVEVGLRFEDKVTVDPSYEFATVMAQLRAEPDLVKVWNGLINLIIDIAARDLASDRLAVDDKVKVEAELADLIDNELYTPKTEMHISREERETVWVLTYDSVPAECPPEQIPQVLDRMRTEKLSVTIRHLWVKLGKLEAIAFKCGVLQQGRYDISSTKADRALGKLAGSGKAPPSGRGVE